MKMSRKFRSVNYEESIKQTVELGEALPTNHLARFVVEVIAILDLMPIYKKYSQEGGEAIDPRILLALLFYGYATGVFSSRKIEKATYESIPFRYIAGGLHVDHDTIAHFRKTFLKEIKGLFLQILLIAQELGLFELGNISADGSKIHADASKSHAISYGRAKELELALKAEIEGLFELVQKAEKNEVELPDGLVIKEEIERREERLANLARAKKVIEARAQERYEAEKAEYDAKMKEREERERETGRKPRGKEPTAPVEAPSDKEQYNFTDPESRIMKNSTNSGYDQHYNVQAVNDQKTMLVVGTAVSNHPNDKQEVIPTIGSIAPELGKIKGAALDNGFFSATNIEGLEKMGIDPYIATGREPHHKDWQSFFKEQPAPPADNASAKVKMAYKLQTEIGQAIYRLRKCTIEPVIGIIKEILGFRQFSLRGLDAVDGEWCLVCLAFNLKRMHVLCTA